MNHRASIRHLLLSLLFLGVAPLVWAEETQLRQERPSFQLSGIEVRGNRLVSADLLIKESGLQATQAYSESRLRFAESRIKRLPFVLDVELSLERGDRYGTFLLVIRVWESKAVFFSYDRFEFDQPEQVNDISSEAADSSLIPSIPVDDRTERDRNDLAFGGRWFVGRFGLVYATLHLANRGDGMDFAPGKPVDFGFSHYNLFGRNVFLNLNVQWVQDHEVHNFDPISRQNLTTEIGREPAVTLAMAWPLRNQSWILVNADRFQESQFHQLADFFTDRIEEKRLTLSAGWLYDTTNDSVLPTQGTRFQTKLEYLRSQSNFAFQELADSRTLEDEFGTSNTFDTNFDPLGGLDSRGTFLRSEVSRYHLWRQRWNFMERLEILYRADESGTPFILPIEKAGSLDVGAGLDLWGRNNTRKYGDLRLEGTLGHVLRKFDPEPSIQREEHFSRAELALAFRNAWGLVRLSARYATEEKIIQRP
ncbi:FtsQ-type POTRA domain-containing protein [Sulfidibacter corallicola]|uniref:FtsQ-type POTRA domain-containing protein n=1 Tax=Sulfidibacter corallicola TaxID=2818388 RepID=A0A8A4TXG2_SULCO|nr:BamA/TamA family outer membrane protein [Sulfidibacter corallicola]QTD53888.1 FtsQ-type POTRA domain-containing protein [Sulfidibacter corallicola]